jgi:hypothetical protein
LRQTNVSTIVWVQDKVRLHYCGLVAYLESNRDYHSIEIVQ